MPAITLPDGSVRQFDAPVTGTTVAEAIGPGLARAALAMKLNGKMVDLSTTIADDADIVFVTRRDVPATNNGSERALRPAVTFRKITNGFRTEWGARLYADIRSVIETARRRSIGALEAIRMTLAGKPLEKALPMGA